MEKCELCKLETHTRRHHLIPRSKGGRETINCCFTCENFLHKTFTNNELHDIYNTVESILQTEQFQRFLKWRLKQKSTETIFKSKRGKLRDKNKYH